jgi:hypothetical protein
VTWDDQEFPVERYRCGKYKEIVEHPFAHPFAHVSPAFGAGCCQPLFNTQRNTILRLRETS